MASTGYPAYTMSPQVKVVPAVQAEPAAVMVPVCGTWSEFLKCPLTIYSVLAFIFFVADIWSIWRSSSMGSNSSTFWITSILSLIIYAVLILVFGYWMKKKCEQCEYGSSWLIFLLAIFFPVILGFIVNVIVGAFAGGLNFLGTSMNGGKGASSGSGPKTAPMTNPTPGGVPIANPTAPVPANNPVTNAAAQFRQDLAAGINRASQLLQ
jgi:hypothetical protein